MTVTCARDGCEETFEPAPSNLGSPQKYHILSCRMKQNHANAQRRALVKSGRLGATAICALDGCDTVFSLETRQTRFCGPECGVANGRALAKIRAAKSRANRVRFCRHSECGKKLPNKYRGKTRRYCNDKCEELEQIARRQASTDRKLERKLGRPGTVGPMPGIPADYYAVSPKIRAIEERSGSA